MFRLRHPLLYTFATVNSQIDNSAAKNAQNVTKTPTVEKKTPATTTEPKKRGRPRKNQTEVATVVENNDSTLKKPVEEPEKKNQYAANAMKFGSGGGDKAGSFNNPIKVTSSSTEEQNKTELAKALNGKTLSAPGGSSSSRNGEVNKAQNSNVSSIAGATDDEVTNAYNSHMKENPTTTNNNNGNNGNGNGQAQNQQSGGDNQQPEERNLVEDVKDGLGNIKDQWGRTVNKWTNYQDDSTKTLSEEGQKKVDQFNKLGENNHTKLSGMVREVYDEISNEAYQANEVIRQAKRGTGVTGWAAAGGAVLGAVGRYRQALKEWEYECQRAAAEGRPMPKKPSLLGSALVGGATGAIGGAALGAVSKRVSSRMGNLDKNLKMQGKMKNINRKSIEDGVDYLERANTWNNMTKAGRREWAQKTTAEKLKTASSHMKNVKKMVSKNQEIPQNMVNYFKQLRYDKKGVEILKQIFGNNLDSIEGDILNSGYNGFFSMYDNLAYIGQCFSLVEDLEEKANKDVEDWKELYNFYILNICDEPIPVNDFLLECYYYPSFINYVEDAIVNFYQKKLITFSSLGGIQKELDQYQSLYNEYRNLVGTNLTATEFMDRCITYDSYVEYIHDKIRRTRLRRLGAMHFANPQSTSLPQNIQIDGQNIDTTQQGLPDPKDANSMQNQNSIQNKQQDAKNRQAQLEQQKQEQQKKQQIEANKANYAKEQHAKEVNEINKLTQKKAEISKNLGRNASDMPMQQLAQEKQKITDLNFKIQNVKSETKNKIANYKGKSSKQFSLRKPV